MQTRQGPLLVQVLLSRLLRIPRRSVIQHDDVVKRVLVGSRTQRLRGVSSASPSQHVHRKPWRRSGTWLCRTTRTPKSTRQTTCGFRGHEPGQSSETNTHKPKDMFLFRRHGNEPSGKRPIMAILIVLCGFCENEGRSFSNHDRKFLKSHEKAEKSKLESGRGEILWNKSDKKDPVTGTFGCADISKHVSFHQRIFFQIPRVVEFSSLMVLLSILQ